MEKHHAGSKMGLQCPRCGEKFLWHSRLAVHMRTCHSTAASTLNSLGGGRSSSSLSGTSSNAEAEGEGEGFKCNFPGCNKTFRQVKCLLAHDRVHTGERPFTCPFPGCTKSFSQASGLRSHTLTHTGERPYACDVCGKTYTTSSRLKVHKRDHTDEKPYVCDVDGCGKSFKQSSNLAQHKLTHLPKGERPLVKREMLCRICGNYYKSYKSLEQHVRGKHPGRGLEEALGEGHETMKEGV
ncbi:hypothetical protein HDV05_004475 [Chytridiales sp. JEL 0842]|nr:hypothetical protein HDV05_004475 [Chytridiales sp. JEL 0842]